MSFNALKWVANLRDVPPTERAVLMVLADCENAKTSQCNPSFDFLGERLSISRRTIQRAVHWLEDVALIETKRRSTLRGQGEPMAYRLLYETQSSDLSNGSSQMSDDRSDMTANRSNLSNDSLYMNQERNQESNHGRVDTPRVRNGEPSRRQLIDYLERIRHESQRT